MNVKCHKKPTSLYEVWSHGFSILFTWHFIHGSVRNHNIICAHGRCIPILHPSIENVEENIHLERQEEKIQRKIFNSSEKDLKFCKYGIVLQLESNQHYTRIKYILQWPPATGHLTVSLHELVPKDELRACSGKEWWIWSFLAKDHKALPSLTQTSPELRLHG